KACVDGQCKEGVPGSGADRCTEDKNCADPPVHNECKDQACQEVSGSDVDSCTIGEDAKCKIAVDCSPEALSKKYGNPAVPFQNAPRLNELMSCISKLGPYGLTMVELGEVSTYDKSNPNCNYTRGNKVPECGINTCSHSINSCHYGGSKGVFGALAVDFGGDPGAGAWEKEKGDKAIEIMKFYCGSNIKSIRCETSAGKAVTCKVGGATHIHISTYGDTCN
ncbi:MAG: hypothetical protein Q8R40_03360, partial [bacterium]|nr:hypothetical protein [bacterium]